MDFMIENGNIYFFITTEFTELRKKTLSLKGYI